MKRNFYFNFIFLISLIVPAQIYCGVLDVGPDTKNITLTQFTLKNKPTNVSPSWQDLIVRLYKSSDRLERAYRTVLNSGDGIYGAIANFLPGLSLSFSKAWSPYSQSTSYIQGESGNDLATYSSSSSHGVTLSTDLNIFNGGADVANYRSAVYGILIAWLGFIEEEQSVLRDEIDKLIVFVSSQNKVNAAKSHLKSVENLLQKAEKELTDVKRKHEIIQSKQKIIEDQEKSDSDDKEKGNKAVKGKSDSEDKEVDDIAAQKEKLDDHVKKIKEYIDDHKKEIENLEHEHAHAKIPLETLLNLKQLPRIDEVPDFQKSIPSSLEEFIQLIKLHNTELIVGQYNVYISRESCKTADASFLPSVGFSASMDHNMSRSGGGESRSDDGIKNITRSNSSWSNSHGWGVSVSVPLDVKGTNRANRRSAYRSLDNDRSSLLDLKKTKIIDAKQKWHLYQKALKDFDKAQKEYQEAINKSKSEEELEDLLEAYKTIFSSQNDMYQARDHLLSQSLDLIELVASLNAKFLGLSEELYDAKKVFSN